MLFFRKKKQEIPPHVDSYHDILRINGYDVKEDKTPRHFVSTQTYENLKKQADWLYEERTPIQVDNKSYNDYQEEDYVDNRQNFWDDLDDRTVGEMLNPDKYWDMDNYWNTDRLFDCMTYYDID